MNKVLIFIHLFALTLGCSLNQEQLERIEPKHKLIANDDCLNQSKGYFNRFGYSISNYFELTFTEAKDLDNNGVVDSIAILSPLELLPEFEFCHKQKESFVENRLLLVNLMNADGTIYKKFRFDNVISNEPTQAIKSGEEYIEVIEGFPGFVLYQDYGQGCYAQYYIYINYSLKGNDFEIDSITFKNFCPGVDTEENIEKYLIESRPFYLKEYERELLVPFKKRFDIIE